MKEAYGYAPSQTYTLEPTPNNFVLTFCDMSTIATAQPTDNIPAAVLGRAADRILAFGEFDSFDKWTAAGGGSDTKPVTFNLMVRFLQRHSPHRQLLFKIGGRTVGMSLTVEGGDTLVARACGNGGNTVTTTSYTIAPEHLQVGFVPITVTHSSAGTTSTSPATLRIFVSHRLVAEATDNSGNDWSGADGVSLSSGSVLACGTGTNDFLAATPLVTVDISTDYGLHTFADAAFPFSDPCGPSPCANGATCITGATATCICPPTFTGPRCTVPTYPTTRCTYPMTGILCDTAVYLPTCKHILDAYPDTPSGPQPISPENEK